MALVYCYGDTPMEDAYAKQAAESLVTAYPNHSWWVECKGGVLVIKHGGISSKIGMVRRITSLNYSDLNFRREVVRAAGELMERAGLPRAAFQGERVTHLEVDKKLEKHFHPPIGMKVIH